MANQFSYDLAIIRDNLNNDVLLVSENYDFYKILEDSTEIVVVDNLDNLENLNGNNIAILHKMGEPSGYQLYRIIASPMRENSDIIYLYTEKGE